MASVTLGVFGGSAEKRQQVASALAKKSTPEDITIYQTVYSGKIMSVIEPTKYPEKVASLAYAAYLSDYCIVIGDAPTPFLGETIIALDLLGKKHGCFITSLDLKPMIKGTSLENFPIFPDFEAAKQEILAFSPEKSAIPGAFGSIDHSFEVKGIGSILLGFMHTGRISVHDRLLVHPSGKELEVRSIQMHDEDVKETNEGDRFGLAIKLLASKDVGRGDFVCDSKTKIISSKSPEMKIAAAKFLKEPLKPQEQIHAFQFLEDLPCKWDGEELQAGKNAAGKLAFPKDFAINPSYPVLLARLDGKGLRIIAKATL